MSRTLRRAGIGAAIVMFAALGLAAQVPTRSGFPAEELDPNPPKSLKTILVDDEIPDDIPDGAFYYPLPAVRQAAADATEKSLKSYLAEFTVAFDRITLADGRQLRVTPVPFLFPNDRKKFPDPFGVVPLDGKNKPGDVESIPVRAVRRFEPFERIALAETDELLAADSGASRSARLMAAELVLSRVLLFHGSARDQNRRRGDVWQSYADDLGSRLTAIRLDRVKQAAADRDWPLVRTLSARMLADPRYARDRKVLEPIFVTRLADAEQAANSNRVADLETLRKALTEFDARFPDSKDATAARVREMLHDRAQKLFEEAERIATIDPGQARNLLKTVEALNPDQPGLRASQRELKSGYSVLVVGTRQLPERMSPALARFDSEKQAVDLMFEGLLEAVPDLPPTPGDDSGGLGVQYIPNLAADRPFAANGVRDFPLVLSAVWAGHGVGRVDPADVTGTVELLRQIPGSWAAEPIDWLDDPTLDPTDPTRVRIRFRRGHPDPRSLLTFKILPARWLKSAGNGAADPTFARDPIGTGPFRRERAVATGPSRDVVFVSNPSYGRRPGTAGLPLIKEIRFTDITVKPDLAEEFRADRLHVLHDVPTTDLSQFQADGFLGGKVRVVTTQSPRRIHLLAVNHRRPALRSVDLRRGLAHAIDREQILKDVFRGGQDRYHKALTGPFPPDSWASPATGSNDPLYDRDLAAAKLKAYRDADGSSKLTLAYPDNDPQARAACEAIKTAVAATATDVTLELTPMPPRQLLDAVEQLHSYDLAYIPFDFGDDWYPQKLGSFLDPAAAGPQERNICGYLTPDSNPSPADDELGRLLVQARLYRDVDGRLVPLAHDIHSRFRDTMPFIPLWRLDRHLVIANSVKVRLDGWATETPAQLLDPTTMFGSIELWEMK